MSWRSFASLMSVVHTRPLRNVAEPAIAAGAPRRVSGRGRVLGQRRQSGWRRAHDTTHAGAARGLDKVAVAGYGGHEDQPRVAGSSVESPRVALRRRSGGEHPLSAGEHPTRAASSSSLVVRTEQAGRTVRGAHHQRRGRTHHAARPLGIAPEAAGARRQAHQHQHRRGPRAAAHGRRAARYDMSERMGRDANA